MRSLEIQATNLDTCVNDAQSERIVITRDGHPVALVLGVQGLDLEQVQLGSSDEFWELIAQRRKEESLSRAALHERIERGASPRDAAVD